MPPPPPSDSPPKPESPPSNDPGSQVADGLVDSAKEAWQSTLDLAVDTGKAIYDTATTPEGKEAAWETAKSMAKDAMALAGLANPGLPVPQEWKDDLKNRVTDTAKQMAEQLKEEWKDARANNREIYFFSKKLGWTVIALVTKRVVPKVCAKCAKLAGMKPKPKKPKVPKPLFPPPRKKTPLWNAARKQGVSYRTAKNTQRIAKKHGVRIGMRPTTPYAKKLLKGGNHKPKPGDLKMKTLTPEDKLLGAKGKPGEIAVYKPKELPPGASEKLKKLHDKRMKEYNENQKLLKGKDKKYFVDENGVVKDKKDGKAFTGDNDVYSIQDTKTGKMLSPNSPSKAERKKYNKVMKDLKNPGDPKSHYKGTGKKATAGKNKTPGADAQHGAHNTWDPKKKNDIKTKKSIDDKHQSPKTDGDEGKEKLVYYDEDGASVGYSDSPDP